MSFRNVATLAALILSTALVGCGSKTGRGVALGASGDAAGQASSATSGPSSPSSSGAPSGDLGFDAASIGAVLTSSEAPVASYTALAPSKAFALATVPEGFAYETLRTVDFALDAVHLDGQPVANTLVTIRVEGAVVFLGRTDAQGELRGQLQISSAAQSVRFDLATIGINNSKTIPAADSMSLSFAPAIR